jgi:predicted metal-dependent hydrolase
VSGNQKLKGLESSAEVKVQVTESTRVRQASATMRHGSIHVKIPHHWSVADKEEVMLELVQRVLKKQAAERDLVEALSAKSPNMTIRNQAELHAFVHQLNAETFQLPLGKIQIGWARYSRLAQVNLRTRTMTVSRFCLADVPESALRYLIIHELAHFIEANHSKRFWALVAQHVPDYRMQSRLMKAYHRRAVSKEQNV